MLPGNLRKLSAAAMDEIVRSRSNGPNSGILPRTRAENRRDKPHCTIPGDRISKGTHRPRVDKSANAPDHNFARAGHRSRPSAVRRDIRCRKRLSCTDSCRNWNRDRAGKRISRVPIRIRAGTTRGDRRRDVDHIHADDSRVHHRQRVLDRDLGLHFHRRGFDHGCGCQLAW